MNIIIDFLIIMLYDFVNEVVMRLKKVSKAIIGAAGFVVLLNIKQAPNNVSTNKGTISIIQTRTLPETRIVEKVVWTTAFACFFAAIFTKFKSMSIVKKIFCVSAGLLVASSIIFGFGNTIHSSAALFKAAGCFVMNFFSGKN